MIRLVVPMLVIAVSCGTVRADIALDDSPLVADDKAAAAVTDPDSAFRATLYWENDGSIFKPNNNTDRWYTNGTAIGLGWRNTEVSRAIAGWVPFSEGYDPKNTAVGVQVSLQMFTPQEITVSSLIETDRPWAGYWAIGGYFQRSKGDEQCATLDHIQLDLGFVGPHTAADDLQIGLHKAFDELPANGWGNQLDDEFTVQFYLRKKWRYHLAHFELNDVPPMDVQVIPQVGVALGTVYRQIEGAVTLRIGFNLPDDFGPDRLMDIGSFTTAGARDGWSGYLYTRLGGRIVEHNMLLEGNNWEDSHGVEEELLVGEIGIGLGIHYRCGGFSFDFTYGQTFVSKEFELQTGSHGYGAFAMTCTWRY